MGMVHGGAKRTRIPQPRSILAPYRATPKSGNREEKHDRASDGDDEPPKGPKARRELGPCPTPQRPSLTGISKYTSILKSKRAPKAPFRADVWGGVTPRNPMGGQRKQERERLILCALNQDVRHRSSSALGEIEVRTYSAPAPLTGAEKLSEGSTC